MHNIRNHIWIPDKMTTHTETIKKWLKSEYHRKGRNFSFKSRNIEIETGVSRSIACKTLCELLNENYPVKIMARPASSCYKWKTVYRGKKYA